MIRSTQTWRHSERGAVAGLRLLGIGLVLLAVAAMGINLVNSDKKPATFAATTTASTTTSTTEPPTTTTTLPMETLKCDPEKFALVVPLADGLKVLPRPLMEKAEKSGKYALIVSPQLCDGIKIADENLTPLVFIGPFTTSYEACSFATDTPPPEGTTTTTTTTTTTSTTTTTQAPSKAGRTPATTAPITTPPPASPGWKVHNIRDLTGDPQTC